MLPSCSAFSYHFEAGPSHLRSPLGFLRFYKQTLPILWQMPCRWVKICTPPPQRHFLKECAKSISEKIPYFQIRECFCISVSCEISLTALFQAEWIWHKSQLLMDSVLRMNLPKEFHPQAFPQSQMFYLLYLE